MNVTAIINGIENGIKFIETMAPLAATLGVPFAGTVAKAAGAIRETIDNVQERVAEGQIVAQSADVEYINVLADRLFAQNEALNEYIANS